MFILLQIDCQGGKLQQKEMPWRDFQLSFADSVHTLMLLHTSAISYVRFNLLKFLGLIIVFFNEGKILPESPV